MKNKVNVAVMFVVLATLLFSVSCRNKIREDEASGTIGQVKKYRKEQMSEKDILLRSEIVKDTSKLGEIIQGLAIFNAYATTLEKSINDRLLDMESIRGFDEKYDQFISELTDFRDFLRNNNAVLMNTVYMLGDFYKDTISESSADVENNLRDFANYVRDMEQKDSILTVMVNNLDTYIEENEKSVTDKEEIEKLKSIRDELLIRVIQQSGVLNDPIAMKSVSEKVLYSVDNLQSICDVDKLQDAYGNIEVLSDWPVASFIYSNTEFLGSGGSAPAGGGQGGEANPPVKPPSDPDFGTGVPLVVQGLIVADQVFVGNIELLSNSPVIGSFVIGVTESLNVAAAVDQLHDNAGLQNTDFLNSILSAQDFIGSTVEGVGGGPILGPPK